MSTQYTVPALSRIEVGTVAYTDGDFLRREKSEHYTIPVRVVRERKSDMYSRYDVEYIRTVYFQGFGLPLSEDYCGSFMTRDNDGNGVFQPEEGWNVREGAQCEHAEFVAFSASSGTDEPRA